MSVAIFFTIFVAMLGRVCLPFSRSLFLFRCADCAFLHYLLHTRPHLLPLATFCSRLSLLVSLADNRSPTTQSPTHPIYHPLRSQTHLGYLILNTFGLSPSWNNNLVSAASFVNSKCFSFLCAHTSAFSVCLASHLVKAGRASSLRAAANASGSRDGEAGLLEGEGR